jgi:hypothetical protein
VLGKMMPASHHMAAGVMVQSNSDYYYPGMMGQYSFAECTKTGWGLGQLSVRQDSAIIYEIPIANPIQYMKLKKYSKALYQSQINQQL